MQLLRMRESIRTVWGNCKLLRNKVYAHVTILSLKKNTSILVHTFKQNWYMHLKIFKLSKWSNNLTLYNSMFSDYFKC